MIFILASQPVQAASYKIEGDLVGAVSYYQVKQPDTLYDIARRFDIGIVELLSANPGIDPWVPTPDIWLRVPTVHILPDEKREGIVLNLPELRMFYYPDTQHVMTFPVGIGKSGWETPTGSTTIVKKRKDPVWIPPASIREEKPDLPEIVPAGPDNPLGKFAMNLGWTSYVIHGTNRPYGIGKRSSHGCIRMYPEDIALLFNHVKTGTPVTIVDTPYKLGWQGKKLFLEVLPTQEQADIISHYKIPPLVPMPEVYSAIQSKAGPQTVIDWHTVDSAIAERSGIPVLIGIQWE